MGKKTITGFSKLSKRGKIKWLVENFFKDPEAVMRELSSYWHKNEEQQKILDGFSENTVSNFPLPYGVSPNYVINKHTYCIPMVIEESSVVAAASSAAKFWMNRGGFQARVLGMKKIGQLHFKSPIPYADLEQGKEELFQYLRNQCKDLTASMEKRGGGLLSIELLDFSHAIENMYQLRAEFDTCDSMGANFINTIMERFGDVLPDYLSNLYPDSVAGQGTEILMAILSNYTPECIVRAEVSCPIEELNTASKKLSGEEFARRFYEAVKIAHCDTYRATTHNKGIFNGIDAVVIATGNDFRAIEAAGHTYAARNGTYSSLSDCSIDDGIFKFWLEIPLSIGTVGGLTALHPIAKRSLELLEHPDAEELMEIIASVGLGQNFAAIRSLVTTGIQQGHMKMHLINILHHLKANEKETEEAKAYFKNKSVSFHSVKLFLDKSRESASLNNSK